VSLKRLWWRVIGHWKAIPTHKWKSTLTCHWNVYSNMSLKKLWWWVTGHWKGYPDMSLKRLLWRITEKSTLMCHWKDFGDEWWVTKKGSLDTSLKSVLWRDGLEIHHLDPIERPSQAPLARPCAPRATDHRTCTARYSVLNRSSHVVGPTALSRLSNLPNGWAL
jgi:hypothetical protein